MNQLKINAKQLHDIEISLNKIQFRGMEIGSVLSYYFDRLYQGDFDNCLIKQFVFLVYYFVKPVSRKKYLRDYQKNIIYFITGKHRHYQKLKEAITYEDLKNKTLIIGQKNVSGLYNGKVFFTSGIIDLFKLIVFIASNHRKISVLFKSLPISTKTKAILYLNIVMQLLKALSLSKFISKQRSVKLICADYDRGSDSSLFFVVAKALKIKSFTLQHGVINPPIGYSPVNADEIWVWGEIAHLQLIDLGVNKKQIKITGTPIVEELEISSELRNEVLNKYKLKRGKTIVLALSSPNKYNDEKMVKFLAEIKKEYGTSFDNFLVKVHPARNYSNYSWIKDDFGIQILPQNIPYECFMNMLDIIIAHNSGLATEALYYGKKVGILDILDESPGNGLELNKYFDIPLLRTTKDFKTLIENKGFIIDCKKIYYKTGKTAKKEIAKHIHHIIN